MLHCYHHPGRAAIVNLDWNEDGMELCTECLLPRLAELEETLVDMFVGQPVIRVARVNTGPFAELPCGRCDQAIVNAVPVDGAGLLCDDCMELEERTVQIIGETFGELFRTVNARMDRETAGTVRWDATNLATAIIGDVLVTARTAAVAMARGQSSEAGPVGPADGPRCHNHVARPAVVQIDWGSDSAMACASCILAELVMLELTVRDEHADDIAGEDDVRELMRDVMISTARAPYPPVGSPVAPAEFRETVAAMLARPAVNPHPTESADTVTCFGCGWPVDAMDDTASMDLPGQPDGFVTWHVDCETEDIEQARLDQQHIAEVEAGEYYGPCTDHGETA